MIWFRSGSGGKKKRKKKHRYPLIWITSQLAVGYAPMSYAELDSIREQGIDAIVNLCGEYCDLHEIEEDSGFEVYYLPIPDECAPDMEEMEKALEWLDEAIYLGKKVLVHCRHGHGRTGTFVSAYLLRKGLGMKMAEKKLKNTPAGPTNYSQWSLLRKYGKKEGQLKLAEPVIEPHSTVDLEPHLQAYREFMAEVDEQLEKLGVDPGCGTEDSFCCREYFTLSLIESIALHSAMNRRLKQQERRAAIERATKVAARLKKLRQEFATDDPQQFQKRFKEAGLRCPLQVDTGCQLFKDRPLRCRIWGTELFSSDKEVEDRLANLSRNVYFALTGEFPPAAGLQFSMADTVSGKFVQVYFHAMMKYHGTAR
ncbi:protein-tyrosine phosphatase family protein [Desulfolithobacter sp.]